MDLSCEPKTWALAVQDWPPAGAVKMTLAVAKVSVFDMRVRCGTSDTVSGDSGVALGDDDGCGFDDLFLASAGG